MCGMVCRLSLLGRIFAHNFKIVSIGVHRVYAFFKKDQSYRSGLMRFNEKLWKMKSSGYNANIIITK